MTAQSSHIRSGLRRFCDDFNPRRILTWLAALAFAVAILGGWQAGVRITNTKRIVLPAPSDIAHALRINYSDLRKGLEVTFGHAIIGLLIASVLGWGLAALLTQSTTALRIVRPVFTILQAVPVIAVAPALVLWFGFGTSPKVITTAFVAFFPFLFNGIAGMRTVDHDALDMFRVLGASRWEMFWCLRLPGSLPFFFSALRVGVGLAVIGATIAEWSGAQVGLGAQLVMARQASQTPVVWACVALLAALVLVMTGLVRAVELTWGHRKRSDLGE